MNRLSIISFVTCLLTTAAVMADNLTAEVTHADPGENNGYIILNVIGGAEPYNFYWTGPDGFTATTKNIYYLAPGEYCVTVGDLLCGVATLCVTVEEEVPASADDTESLRSVTLYPNPFDDVLTIRTNQLPEIPESVALMDLYGQLLYHQEWPAGAGSCTFEGLSILPPGPYLLRLTETDGAVYSFVLIR